MLSWPCPHCGQTLRTNDELAGWKIKCAHCGHKVAAPTSSDTATLPPLPPTDDAATLPPQTEPAPAAAAGPVVVPGYDIRGELGRGGMGVVYKARQEKLQRLVALKMILSGGHAGETDLARFRTEAEAIARLQHPNIVQIYEVGEVNGLPFFSLEFCGGGSLEKKLAGTPLPPKKAAQLVQTLAEAMHVAHQKGIIHRDLKPANVLLTADGTPKITDFGLAKKLDQAGQTATGAMMGTPSYMAPEQAGGKEIGPAADIYALGAILYECLTGRPPFRAATPLDTILQVISDEPVPPRQLQSRTPKDLENICLKCLHKDPTRRYRSAKSLADDLRRFANGQPVRARPVGRVELTLRWVRRNPVVAGLLAVLLVGTALTTALSVWALDEKDRADQNAAAARHSEEEKDQQVTRAEWMVYANQLAMAQSAWNDNRADVAWDYLKRTRRDYRGWEYRYLTTEFLQNQRIFRPRDSEARVVSFSPDGEHLAIASAPSFGEITFALWNVETGQKVRAVTFQTRQVFAMALSPDGKHLAAALVDQSVRLWDTGTGQELWMHPGNKGRLRVLAFSPDGKRLALAFGPGRGSLAGASDDRTVRIWEAAKGQEVLTLTGHTGAVLALAFSPDGERLASASSDKTVRLWNAETGKELRTLKGHTDLVNAAAFSPDGKHLASASSDKTVRLWDTEMGQDVRILKGHTGSVTAVAFSPNGKRIASGSHDRTVRLWDVETGKEVVTFKGHTNAVSAVRFGPNRTRLASFSLDGTVRVWDMDQAQETRVLKGHTSAVVRLVFSPDGQRLASASLDPTVRLWDMGTQQVICTINDKVSDVAVSPDGKRLTGILFDGAVRVWDTETGQPLLTHQQFNAHGIRLCLSPDGKHVAIILPDRTVRLKDVDTGQEVHTCLPDALFDPSAGINSLGFSSDGKRLAVFSPRSGELWDTDTGEVLVDFKGLGFGKSAIAFSSDGKRLAAINGNAISVLDTDTGRQSLSLQGHTDSVTALTFTPDGHRLASASADQTVRLWDLTRGQEVLTLRGHTDKVTALAFSPDGKRLASGCEDGTIRLWDADREPEE